MVKKSSKSPAAATAAARSKIKPAGGSSKRKGGKNVKSFWKYFCSSLVTVLFFWGLHSLAAQFNPAYKTFVDKQFNRLRSALSQGAENLKPELIRTCVELKGEDRLLNAGDEAVYDRRKNAAHKERYQCDKSRKGQTKNSRKICRGG